MESITFNNGLFFFRLLEYCVWFVDAGSPPGAAGALWRQGTDGLGPHGSEKATDGLYVVPAEAYVWWWCCCSLRDEEEKEGGGQGNCGLLSPPWANTFDQKGNRVLLNRVLMLYE